MLSGERDDIVDCDALCCNLPSYQFLGPSKILIFPGSCGSEASGISFLLIWCAWGNDVVGDSHGSGIVNLDGRLPLGTFHLYERLV